MERLTNAYEERIKTLESANVKSQSVVDSSERSQVSSTTANMTEQVVVKEEMSSKSKQTVVVTVAAIEYRLISRTNHLVKEEMVIMGVVISNS